MDPSKNRLNQFNLYYKYYRYFGFRTLQSLIRNRKNKTAWAFGNVISYTHEFWFIHSLKEIFIDKVYSFKSDKKSPLIIDCGSNIGLSIIYFKQLFPDSEIIGFEPDPKSFEILKRNMKAFSLAGVELINKAVCKQNDVLVFDSKGSIGSSLTTHPEKANNPIEVQAVSLDDFIKDREVDFLKIDIEGAEHEVLFSCKEHLSNVKNLFVEYHSLPGEKQILSDLLLILRNAGFRYYMREAWENLKHPYVSQKTIKFDLQLNIFAYRYS